MQLANIYREIESCKAYIILYNIHICIIQRCYNDYLHSIHIYNYTTGMPPIHRCRNSSRSHLLRSNMVAKATRESLYMYV
jgi:hypothetical protein